MPNITSDQIRDISVKTVESFLNNKVPLSVGLAKQASAMGLNADQIQRAVEATNSIAYLKVLSLSEDRTVEFPLCKYAEVMAEISVPDLTKAAAYRDAYLGPVVSLEKTASAEEHVPSEMTQGEQNYWLIKAAAINERKLEALTDREATIVPELIKAAQVVAKDKAGLEKLATVTSGKEFAMASVLVYGEAKPYADTGIFKTAELKDATKLIGLLKEAQEVSNSINELRGQVKRTDMLKEASIAGSIGKGIGMAAGKVIGAPFKAVGSAVGKSVARGSNTVANMARKAVGAPTVASSVKGIGAAGLIAGGAYAASDALMYTPGVDKTTGRSNDVWKTLQKEPGN